MLKLQCTLWIGLGFLLLASFPAHAKAPADRNQFLRLAELFRVVALAKKAGIPPERLNTITLRDGYRTITLNDLLPALELFISRISDDPTILNSLIPIMDRDQTLHLLSLLKTKINASEEAPKKYLNLRDLMEDLNQLEYGSLQGLSKVALVEP